METKPPLSGSKKVFFSLIAGFTILVGLIGISEVVLRVVGLGPWTKQKTDIQVEPGGTFFVKHPTLGYTHLPGAFHVTLPDGYAFNVTDLPNTLRVTHPLATYDSVNTKEEIWIFGCSFTYGWALNDNETFAWLLQERFPQYEVVNYGVNGYGTLHSLIQFREALAYKKPKVAILAYASFHDARNTFLRKRQKAVATWNSLGPLVQPYARLDDDGQLEIEMAEVEYREFPLMRKSAVAHLIEMTYDNYEAWRTPSDRVTEAIISEMAKTAHDNGVGFGVALIAGRPDMLKYTRAHGISSVDMSVDLSLPENNNEPHDNHPSALANRHYADTLESFLRGEIARK